jgi:hypothetical protein
MFLAIADFFVLEFEEMVLLCGWHFFHLALRIRVTEGLP